MSEIDELRTRLSDGEVDGVRRVLAGLAAAASPEAHSGHESCVALGELCEEAGLFEIARAEYEAALAASPADRRALRLLLDLCEARGDRDRLLKHLGAAFERSPADGEILARLVPELRARALIGRAERALVLAEEAGADADVLAALREAAPRTEDEEIPADALVPPDADLVRFLSLFGGREDVHARQWHDRARGTGYAPVHQPLTPSLLRNHLLGNVTLGVYPIRLDGTVSFFAVDVDVRANLVEAHRSDAVALSGFRSVLLERTRRLAARLAELGFAPLVEDSGYKGRHLWVFFEDPVPAARVHVFGRLLLAWAAAPEDPISLEFFPKQGSAGRKGLGNLIKLPLGIHRRSGRRSVFLGPEEEVLREPFVLLRRAPLATAEDLDRAIGLLERDAAPEVRPASAPGAPPPAPRPPAGPLPLIASPEWTDGHFESDPSVRRLFAGCAVLRALKEKVERERHLTWDEQLVLRHVLGHHPRGHLAVNHLLARCREVREEMPLSSPLRGSPASCSRIRRRVPEIVARVPCDCRFPFAPQSYPTPLLHLLAEDAEPPPERDDPESIARAYGAVRHREADLDGDRWRLEETLRRAILASPDRRLDLPEGRYELDGEGPDAPIVWRAAPPPPEGEGGA